MEGTAEAVALPGSHGTARGLLPASGKRTSRWEDYRRAMIIAGAR